MDRKLVFFDIDGTIYKYTSGIPRDTITSIRKLAENGHIPVICTGRTRVMIYDEFLEPGFKHIIAGAGTYAEADGEVLYLYELPDSEIKEAINGFRKYGFSPIVEGYNTLCVEFDNVNETQRSRKIIHTYKENIKECCVPIDMNKEIHASKISGVYLNNSDYDGMIKEFGDRYTLVNHENKLLELIPKGYTKATGIKAIMERMNIPWEKTYAFGDSFNDLEMLEYVKYGICMGNSDPELFKHTEFRTDDFDKGGITNALIRFGLI